MLDAVIIRSDKSNLENFSIYLKKNLCNEVKCFNDLKYIIDFVKNKYILLIVRCGSNSFDSVKLVQKILKSNAFTSVAVISNDTHEEFENRFEGLGVLMQLSDPPSKHETKTLCEKLNRCLVNTTGGAQ